MEIPRKGETITHERTFTVEDVRQFAALSGDTQPRHTVPDEEGRLMVPGLLTATMPTKLGGDRKALSPRMEFEFRKPVYTGERIVCTATYGEVVERDDRYEFSWDVSCENEAGDVVLDATVDGLVRKDG